MSSKLVERRLNDFKRRCGKDGDAALQLAYHAAMPVALNPELLHFLRINFFLDPPEQLPYNVEFEFLTSGLCREIDAELYEIEPEIRSKLLQKLMRREDAHQRIRDVATLLWQYVEYHSPWADRVELERAQQLTALNFLDPAKAKEWLDEAEASPSLGTGEREWFVAMQEEIKEISNISDDGSTLNDDNVTSLNNLANLYYSQGRYADAEPLYRQALEIRRRVLGEEHPDVTQSLNNLASLYESQGRYAEAEALFQQALVLGRRVLGEEHPHFAQSLNNLASIYESQGRYTEAETLFQRALKLTRRSLGDEHPYVATILNNLAVLYYSQRKYAEAEQLCLQALELTRRSLGDEHPDVATSLNNLAELYYSQGKYTEAELLYQQALQLRRRLLGDEHPDVATSLNNLAELYYSQGKYTEAEPLYQQALEICERQLGVNHPDTVTVRKNLANLQAKMSARQKGEQLQQLQKALLSAFPTPDKLKQMVRFRLDEKLEAIITGTSLSEIVFQLIEWAETRGRLEELLTAAIEQNPQNPQLRSFYEQVLGTLIAEEQSRQDDLSSNKSVNYTRLRDVLAAGKWKEADEETLAVMLQVAGREEEGWLDIKSIENFPCTDLRTIDQLWVKYSNGRFGFSVQKRIWESVGGNPNADYETFKKFGDCVGWLLKNKLLDHKDLQFNLNAPLGHLPSHVDLIGFDSLGGSLFSRVQTCEVEATKVSENG